MKLNIANYNVVTEGQFITYYPKAEITGQYKAPIQTQIEGLLNEGKIKEVLLHDGFAKCVSPSFSGQCVLDSAYLELKQVVVLPGVTEMLTSKEAINHATQLQQRIIELIRTIDVPRTIKHGSKANRRNLALMIDGEWIRLRGFTVDFCYTNKIATL